MDIKQILLKYYVSTLELRFDFLNIKIDFFFVVAIF